MRVSLHSSRFRIFVNNCDEVLLNFNAINNLQID